MYVFVVGMERSGTHTVKNIIAASCPKVKYWATHESEPLLCREAQLFMARENYHTDDLIDKIKKFQIIQKTCELVCEANHRLGFFVNYLNASLPKAKFIWCIRNPIHTIISRIASFAHWKEIIDRYPDFFQQQIKTQVPTNKLDFNTYRIKPPSWDMSLDELYIWEWLATYKETRRQLSLIPPQNRKILQTEYITRNYKEILGFIDKLEETEDTRNWAGIKADSVFTPDRKRNEVIAFAQKLIVKNKKKIANKILDEFGRLDKSHNDLANADKSIIKQCGVLI